MSAPYVLVASCSEKCSPDILTKQILAQEHLPQCTVLMDEIKCYPWQIDTKYYTTEVLLCTTESRTIGNEDFAARVEAVLIYFDGNDRTSFNQVKSWMPFVKELNPEIRMLICDGSLASDDIPRQMVQEWCLDYSFELVELAPEQEQDSDTEDDFVDSFGINRIHQALYAHTWSNLKMKEEPNIRSPYFQQLMKEQAEENAKEIQERLSGEDLANSQHQTTPSETKPSCTVCENQGHSDGAVGGITADGTPITEVENSSKEEEKKPKQRHKNDILDSLIPSEDSALFESLSQDDQDGESFEKIFSQLKLMKDTSDSLPPDQRKGYAEQMAVSFWRAIGGDEEEIANLSDSSNN